MKKSLIYRVHEWLAERIAWVQYPQITLIAPRKPFFKHQMPLSKRIDIFLFSLVLLLVALVFIGLIVVTLYAFLR